MIRQHINSLQNLITDGILEPIRGKEQINMLKEQSVLDIHNTAINQRSDGRWVTKVKSDKNKQKSSCTYEGLIDKLYDFYFGNNKETLSSLFTQWVEYRKNETCTSDKTIRENIFLWNALLRDTEFTQKPIANLKPITCISFFRKITKERTLTRKRFNDMKSILNGIFYYAIEKEILEHNPLLEINYRQFPYKAESNNVIPYSEEERIKIINYLGNSLYDLAIKLSFYMPIRIGELKALKFSDINGDFLYIQRYMNDKHIIIEDTKGHSGDGKRYIPITSACKAIIEKIKYINSESEYMFILNNKPITTCTYNNHLRRCCNTLGIQYRSSHKARFSTASILHKNGVDATELQRMLGHTTLTMTNHYLRNVTPAGETVSKMTSILG